MSVTDLFAMHTTCNSIDSIAKIEKDIFETNLAKINLKDLDELHFCHRWT